MTSARKRRLLNKRIKPRHYTLSWWQKTDDKWEQRVMQWSARLIRERFRVPVETTPTSILNPKLEIGEHP